MNLREFNGGSKRSNGLCQNIVLFSAEMFLIKEYQTHIFRNTSLERRRELYIEFITNVQSRTGLEWLQPLPCRLPSNCIVPFWRMRKTRRKDGGG